VAYSCAIGGELHRVLAQQSLDEELLYSAGEIISALIDGVPPEDIYNFEHAAELINRYLNHLNGKSKNLGHYLVLQAISSYLQEEYWDESEAEECGWSEELRAQGLKSVQNLSERSRWIDLAYEGLSSSDQFDFYIADQAAHYLGIDTWDFHWHRLCTEPMNYWHWNSVLSEADECRIGMVITYAIEVLPLDKLASCAGEVDFGPSHDGYKCLNKILESLIKYPGKGEKLLLAGLASPVVDNRINAVRALSAWTLAERSDKLNLALREAIHTEPSDEVRIHIRKVLNGEEIN
jgi:hypothetical protein